MNYCFRPFSRNCQKKANCFKRLILFGLILFGLCKISTAKEINLNANTLINLNRGMQAFGFRTQSQWDTITIRYLKPYEPAPFTPGDSTVLSYLMYPYWQGNAYKNYQFKKIKRLGYFAYLINPENGLPALTYSWTVSNAADAAAQKECKIDLVAYCDGSEQTDYFLQSPEARKNCITQLIALANTRRAAKDSLLTTTSLKKANGINVYFPNFDFSSKRNFGLFLKELYLNYCYQNDSLQLSVTLPMRDTIQYHYLKSISMYIDDLYFADFNANGSLQNSPLTNFYFEDFHNEKGDLSLFAKIAGEFLLAEVSNPLKAGNEKSFLNNWISYLLLIGIVYLLIFIVLILYLFWNKANQLINDNLSVCLLLLALLICESAILFIFMIEYMNYTTLLINVNNPGAHYFLLIPIVLVAVYPLSRLLKQNHHLP